MICFTTIKEEKKKRKMVKICSLVYPEEDEPQYQFYYDNFSYQLHDFQKWSIEAITSGNNLLVTAPTGTGKSMPAEFSIDFFHSRGKKSIYCSPIKSLSNQKFYDFKLKYPHISIGLITGDIKTNTSADVLIMTTEILLNKLYQLRTETEEQRQDSLTFDMDIGNDLGCVIFDEIHMINDKDRGHVWENCILLLPSHIQIVGLSATLKDPEKFAAWLESKENRKEVYLAKKLDRPVPLTHYSFITANSGVFKAIKDKSAQEEIRSIIDKPFVIQSAAGLFNDLHYTKMNKILRLFNLNDVRVRRQHVINQVSKHLVENEMLPALCYVFSRKKLEICANEITANLLEFDSKIPYTIDNECEQIIRKLPNFKEYLHLPEYVHLVSLLRKGVGIHHAGMMSILREIVEILFAKGMIKMLFCTTSVAIGLNLPVKTCIFTDINKHDGEQFTVLQGHEYTQAAGRAGRLGLDTVGHVIHLNNLFDVEPVSYKNMLKGNPQTLVSKFKVSYNLMLNMIDQDISRFASQSMIKTDIDGAIRNVENELTKVQNEVSAIEVCMKHFKTPTDVMIQYIDLSKKLTTTVNKKKKECLRDISVINENYKFIESEKVTFLKHADKMLELNKLQKELDDTSSYIDNNVAIVLNLLLEESFVDVERKLTLKGKIASHLREIHCLVFATLIERNEFDSLSIKQIVAVLSCFTSISVKDELKAMVLNSNDILVQDVVSKIERMYSNYKQKETHLNFDTTDTMHYDLVNYVSGWCDCESVEECKFFLQTLEAEKEIFLGEFVKALLKINTISFELEKVAEMIGNIELLSKLREIPQLTLKYIATNQSLYV
jgi:superfamily II RNA helicase